MKKWVCPVCGYVHEGETAPEKCPQCGVPGAKFKEQGADMTWAAEHVVGVGKTFGADVPAEVQKEIIDGLNANFAGECTEVGMYLAMARVAHREGYPEIGLYWEKAAYEEADRSPMLPWILSSASLFLPNVLTVSAALPSHLPLLPETPASTPADPRKTRLPFCTL